MKLEVLRSEASNIEFHSSKLQISWVYALNVYYIKKYKKYQIFYCLEWSLEWMKTERVKNAPTPVKKVRLDGEHFHVHNAVTWKGSFDKTCHSNRFD